MIDDFTAHIRQTNEAPLQTIVRKLEDLVKLGINAIEFMPWTAWTYPDDPNRDFSWDYNPVQYFSVAHKYTLNPSNETDKLVYLTQLINECHKRDIHVIMDGVFNHADASPPDRGFPYYWLYQEPADSPYVGNFAEAAFFQDLDYANQCTLEYIRDACIYWIDTFKVDGIRFDNTLGMYRPGDRGHGLPKPLSELRGHLSRTGNKNFAIILEHSWDYAAIDATKKVGAASCWLDPYRSLSMGYLGDRPQGIPQIEPPIMRMLDSGRDFDAGRVPTIYIENHDHRRFMLKAGGRDYWYLTQPYLIALFTCAGAPLIYNGQEFGQDNDMPESGEGRVVPRPVNWDLRDNGPGPEIFARYQQMMNIRKAYPGLRSSNFYRRDWNNGWTQLNPQGFGIDRDRNVVVYHRWGDDGHGHLERFYVVLNFSSRTQHVAFEVPDSGPWRDRILITWRKYDLHQDAVDLLKLQVLEGAMYAPNFGLPPQIYNQLAESVDSVIQSSGSTDYVPGYLELRSDWVLGLLGVTQFCFEKRAKRINYIGSVIARLYDTPADFQRPDSWWYSGYAQMKWVNQQILGKLAALGFPAQVCEAPYILGSTIAGKDSGFNYSFWRAVSFGALLQLVWDSYFLDFTAVDLLVESVLKNAFAARSLPIIRPTAPYRIHNSEIAPLMGCRVVPWEVFRQEVKKYATAEQMRSMLADDAPAGIEQAHLPPIYPEGLDVSGFPPAQQLARLYLKNLNLLAARQLFKVAGSRLPMSQSLGPGFNSA